MHQRAPTFQQKGRFMSGHVFTHSEADLVRSLGLNAKDIRAVRTAALTRGTHWQHVAGEVRYSADGRTILLSSLKISSDDSAALASPAPLQHARASLCATLAAQASAAALVADAIAARLRSDLAAPVGYSAPKKSAERPAQPRPPARVAPPRPGEVRELVCLRTYALNKRIVLAKFGAAEVRVRVRDSANLTAGLTMQCRFLSADLWELAQRLPRWRGKW
jgi:hypothetical protein